MIKRKINNRLLDFYSNIHKALLLTGARQTGKSFSIRYFGQSNFKHFIEINFVEQPTARSIFVNATNVQDILMRLSAFTSEKLVRGETLIFLDEIQECPEALTAVKFLVEEGSYRYIMSGSLLGVEMKDLRSAPVGYIDVWEMFPLDMEEFFNAIGVSESILTHIHTSCELMQPIDPVVHEKLMAIFRLYLIVGGMPAVVQKYLDTNNLQLVIEEQRAILRLYEMDIAKYDPNNKLYIREIFRLIPPELNAKNKRFILKNLNEHIKFSRYENSFIWLKDAGVALPTFCVEEPKAPLVLSRSRNLFKLFQNDVGLLAASYADGIQMRILNDDPNINFGAIYENFVAQELRCHGFDLFYFNSKKQGEVDFLIEKAGKALPIEVKSGKAYQRHNALTNILSDASYDIREALVLSGANLSMIGCVKYMPIYLLMFLTKEEVKPILYKVELP
ncbi:MAG: ATP-binding protein [Parabacteroides sp.]